MNSKTFEEIFKEIYSREGLDKIVFTYPNPLFNTPNIEELCKDSCLLEVYKDGTLREEKENHRD